jgi:hypothetical protein
MKYRKPSPQKLGKRFEVIKATTKPIDGIDVGGKHYKFGPNGAMYLSDSGVAAEIEQVYGHRKGNGDVTVSPVEFREHGHNYFFGAPNTKEYRDNFDRIFRRYVTAEGAEARPKDGGNYVEETPRLQESASQNC